MNEVMLIFSLAAAGCLVRLTTDLVLQVLARRVSSGTLANGPNHGSTQESRSKADPVVALGLTLTCYGTIAMGLVSELPGEFAFQRTGLVFALLCVGGLVGEISRTGTTTAAPDGDADEREPVERTPTSVGLSAALMLALNLAIAVLAGGQGLVHIVPPPAPAVGQSAELEQIVVVAKRESNSASGRASDSMSFL
jgi:hypothetical protein